MLSTVSGAATTKRMENAMEDKTTEDLRDDEDHSKLKAWEDLCEGTYPGYGDTEFEARAYASLTEVLDEAKSREVVSLMEDRFAWASDMLLFHRAYEEDERITGLVNLLLHHGWEPPVFVGYMSVTRRKELHPSDLEELDFGAAMEELAGGYDRDHDHPHSSAS